jgi:type I restriction enzyme M protein
VARIAPKFLEDLAAADAEKARLDAKVKAAEEAEAARAAAALGVLEDGEPADSDEVSEAGPALDPTVAEALLSEADLKKAKRDRTAAGKAVKALEDAFYPLDGLGARAASKTARSSKPPESAASDDAVGQTTLDVTLPAELDRPTPGLHEARDALDEAGARDIVLGILRDDLASKLEGHVVRRRRELIDTYLGWERKYVVSLREIEARREAAAERLNEFLKELGYVG